MPSLDARTMQTVAEMRALYEKVALCTIASVRTRHSCIGKLALSFFGGAALTMSASEQNIKVAQPLCLVKTVQSFCCVKAAQPVYFVKSCADFT